MYYGSEYINRHVAQLLNKLLIELTKSRARQTNDNALVESKNGAIVRKHLGYSHIPQRFAPLINAFNRNHLNPHINFHRPCFFPIVITDAQGKQRKSYPYQAMMTPYDKLKSLPESGQYLNPGSPSSNSMTSSAPSATMKPPSNRTRPNGTFLKPSLSRNTGLPDPWPLGR